MDKKIILIVDDEPVNINIVAGILHEFYEIRVATSGQNALDILRDEKPDLILLDVVMPQMDGYEVAKHLKKNIETINIPIIFLTAQRDPESIVKGFNEGAVDYISKPFAKEELLARVTTHLKIHRLQQSLSQAVDELEDKMEQLQKSKQEFEMIFNHSHNGIALTDLETNFILLNDSYSRITGYSKEELLHKSCTSLSQAKDTKLLELVMQKGHVENIEKRWIVKDNKIVYTNISISLMPDQKTLLFNAIDITKLKKAEEKIAHYVEVMDKNVIYSSTDLKGKIVDVSQAFCDVLGYDKEELIGKSHNITRHSDMPKGIYQKLWDDILQNHNWSGEMKNRKKDGTFYWAKTDIFSDFDDDSGQKIGYTAIRQNITDKKNIEELAIQDELTKVYNRRYFNQIMDDRLNSDDNLSFMMIDLDHFKDYNDTYGHQEGDKVLKQIGQILNQFATKSGDFAFRLGGEEFALLLKNASREEAIESANALCQNVMKLGIDHRKNSAANVVTVSVGLVYKPKEKSLDKEEIYQKADENLYKAKESGRNRVYF
ncbi:MAG: diguanylate cyclase [Campylobacterota bacterium]|nr:diguanylate cyclase [Campylobacterota bacterium]